MAESLSYISHHSLVTPIDWKLDDLCAPVQTRLRQQLEAQLKHLSSS